MSTTYQIVYPYVVMKNTENTCAWYNDRDSINTCSHCHEGWHRNLLATIHFQDRWGAAPLLCEQKTNQKSPREQKPFPTRYGLRAIWVFRTMKKDYTPERSAIRLLDALMQTVPSIVREDVHFWSPFEVGRCGPSCTWTFMDLKRF